MVDILIVEDDENTRTLFGAILSGGGYRTHLAEDGMEALTLMERQHIDLLVVDVMMPNMDGYELTKHLRGYDADLPILMASAKHLPEDRVQGFLVGTDDYITKPVNRDEMLLRVKALLRRAKIASERRIAVGEVVLDHESLTVRRGALERTLPQKEFYLLYKLLSYPGKIFTRPQLMDEIWGMDTRSSDDTLNVHINRLRGKLQCFSEFEIVTVRGLGYKAVKHVAQ